MTHAHVMKCLSTLGEVVDPRFIFERVSMVSLDKHIF